MNLVLLTKAACGWPRPLWIEVLIDECYIERIITLSKRVLFNGGKEEVIEAQGHWQRQGEFKSCRLQTCCRKHVVTFRLVSNNGEQPVYSQGICTLILKELFHINKPGKRVFYAQDQAILMALYHSTQDSAS